MEEDSPIKEILYDVIKEIPEKEIQILFESGNQSKLIENLFEKTLPRINTISGDIMKNLVYYQKVYPITYLLRC